MHARNRIAAGILMAALALLASGSGASPKPRGVAGATLISSTQIIGLKQTANAGGFRLTAAITPMGGGSASSATRAGYRLTLGPAVFAGPPTTDAPSSAESWTVY